jgi:imidazolonepropionase-like amidohydrolase
MTTATQQVLTLAIVALSLGALRCAARQPQQPSPTTMIFEHVNVIDGVSKGPSLDTTVVVSAGKITNVGNASEVLRRTAVTYDMQGKWMMPGYVDAHVHFANVERARTALRYGATTVRTMQCDHFVDVQIRDAHRQGREDLPDVVTAGYQIRPDMSPAFFEDFPQLADLRQRVSGADNVRRVVRALVSRGVDHIKFLATERSGTPETDPRKRTFSDDEIAALVDEARKAGRRVAAHAHGDEGASAAVKSGVHSIEHGTFMAGETLTAMQQRGTFYVPTFTVDRQPPTRPEDRDNPILAERRRIGLPLRAKLTGLAESRGIPLAAGTDLRYDTPDLSMADEALYLEKAGVLPARVLQIMTSGSATLLGVQNRTGAIKAGLEADLVVLGANPLAGLEALKDIRMIVNDGKVAFRKPE